MVLDSKSWIWIRYLSVLGTNSKTKKLDIGLKKTTLNLNILWPHLHMQLQLQPRMISLENVDGNVMIMECKTHSQILCKNNIRNHIRSFIWRGSYEELGNHHLGIHGCTPNRRDHDGSMIFILNTSK
jgi:hypothetical protein